jgi:hypothetical protein
MAARASTSVSSTTSATTAASTTSSIWQLSSATSTAVETTATAEASTTAAEPSQTGNAASSTATLPAEVLAFLASGRGSQSDGGVTVSVTLTPAGQQRSQEERQGQHQANVHEPVLEDDGGHGGDGNHSDDSDHRDGHSTANDGHEKKKLAKRQDGNGGAAFLRRMFLIGVITGFIVGFGKRLLMYLLFRGEEAITEREEERPTAFQSGNLGLRGGIARGGGLDGYESDDESDDQDEVQEKTSERVDMTSAAAAATTANTTADGRAEHVAL